MFWLFCGLTTGAAAPAATIEDEPRLEDRVNRAIEEGVAYLRAEQQNLEGRGFESEYPDYPGGVLCLTAYTLLMCGVPAGDPVVQRLERRVAAVAGEVSHTYTLSLALLALLAGDRDQHGAAIALLIARLEGGQLKQEGAGAWGYTLPEGRTQVPGASGLRKHADAHWAAPDDWFDNSNSQYAVLALRSAVDFGFAVDPRVFELAALHFLDEQKSDGGFSYSETHRPNAYISMTAGAAGSLVMCADVLEESESTRKLRRQVEVRLKHATRWLDRKLRFPPDDAPWPFYAAYAVERFGHYAHLDRFGDQDWYREGATWLVETQLEAGCWSTSAAPARGRAAARGPRARRNRPAPADSAHSLVNTCFALLFLKRSSFVHTRMSDEVLVLLKGIDRQARRSDLDGIQQRILSAGPGALPQLVKGLFLPSEPAQELADECLRELTGEDFGYQHARDEEERRRAREAWVRFLMTREDYGKLDP